MADSGAQMNRYVSIGGVSLPAIIHPDPNSFTGDSPAIGPMVSLTYCRRVSPSSIAFGTLEVGVPGGYRITHMTYYDMATGTLKEKTSRVPLPAQYGGAMPWERHPVVPPSGRTRCPSTC